MQAEKLIPISLAAAAALVSLIAAPIATGAATPAGTVQTSLRHGGTGVLGLHPLRSGQQASLNWAGYVASAGGYTHISGQWHVPTVTATADNRYSSTWAGIGGDPSPDLIQAGTEQDSVGGHPVYDAWTEILPEPETVAFTVSPGDLMSVDIAQGLFGMWTITLKDLTNGRSVTRSTPYTSTESTAEWIHEATSINGQVATLAKTTNAVFDLGKVNGKTIKNAGSLDTIIMQDNSGRTIAVPGPLDSDGDGFQVADGSTAPPAPAS